MRKTLVGVAAAGLLGGAAAVLLPLLPANAATPNASTCLPPAGSTPTAPPGSPVTASGVISVLGQQGSGVATCSYTFTSNTAPQYVAATPNAFTITATHTYTATNGACPNGGTLSGTTCTVTDASVSSDVVGGLQAGNPPSSGEVTGTLTGSQAGDTITVTATLACVPGDPTGQACGGIGTIAVGSPS